MSFAVALQHFMVEKHFNSIIKMFFTKRAPMNGQ